MDSTGRSETLGTVNITGLPSRTTSWCLTPRWPEFPPHYPLPYADGRVPVLVRVDTAGVSGEYAALWAEFSIDANFAHLDVPPSSAGSSGGRKHPPGDGPGERGAPVLHEPGQAASKRSVSGLTATAGPAARSTDAAYGYPSNVATSTCHRRAGGRGGTLVPHARRTRHANGERPHPHRAHRPAHRVVTGSQRDGGVPRSGGVTGWLHQALPISREPCTA